MAEISTKEQKPAPPTKRVALWNVMVRHSTFLLKQADVEADTPEEAKKKFLELARQRTDFVASGEAKEVALRNGGNRTDKEKARVMKTYHDGLLADQRGELVWEIEPSEKVKEKRAELKNEQLSAVKKMEKMFGALELALSNKA